MFRESGNRFRVLGFGRAFKPSPERSSDPPGGRVTDMTALRKNREHFHHSAGSFLGLNLVFVGKLCKDFHVTFVDVTEELWIEDLARRSEGKQSLL